MLEGLLLAMVFFLKINNKNNVLGIVSFSKLSDGEPQSLSCCACSCNSSEQQVRKAERRGRMGKGRKLTDECQAGVDPKEEEVKELWSKRRLIGAASAESDQP